MMHVLSQFNLIYTDQVYKENSTKIKDPLISWENFYKKELFSSNFLNAWFVDGKGPFVYINVQCSKLTLPLICVQVTLHVPNLDRDCFVRYIFISLYLNMYN